MNLSGRNSSSQRYNDGPSAVSELSGDGVGLPAGSELVEGGIGLSEIGVGGKDLSRLEPLHEWLLATGLRVAGDISKMLW